MQRNFGLDVRRTLQIFAATCSLGCVLAPLHGAQAQGTTQEWTTSSADPSRDAWQRGTSGISPQTAKNLTLLWKTKVENKTMGMQSFREPLIINGVKTASGEKTITILAGAANDVFVLDASDGTVLWKKKLKWESVKPQEPGEGRGFICTNAQSATPVVTPAGAATRLLYVLASDGYLHTMDLATGDEPDAAIKVLPQPYGKPYGLNLVNDVIYTVTGQGCGGVPNALYAVDLKTRKVAVSSPPQAGLWGVAGPAVGSDDTVYFSSGDGPYDAASDVDQESGTRWGGAVGAGLEFGFAPDWSVALEYDHLFMGSRNITLSLFGLPTRIDGISQDVDMGTVRVNYRFGGPVVARY